MIDYQEIGNNIKICRIRCNLKQAELAEMVGVTSQHISHVERCQTKPSLTLLVDISTALRVDLYTLLGSNIPVHPDVSISVEFASMLKDAAPVWGDRIFEKCGIRRDEGGDGGKTLEIRGKRRLSARDGGANYQQS